MTAGGNRGETPLVGLDSHVLLVEGSDADVVTVDPEKSAAMDHFHHAMEPRYSTFHGRELTGLPTHTIVGGEVVAEDGELQVEKGCRGYLTRGPRA